MTRKGVRQNVREVTLKVEAAEYAVQHPEAQRRSGNFTADLNSQLRYCRSSNSADVKSYKLNLH